MDIQIIYQDAPLIAPEIERELLSHDPRTILLWNPAARLEPNGASWEPRWEIWKELKPSRHPDATNQLYRNDLWSTDHQCWMRKLQTYTTSGGSFAPADRALITGLEMANSWASRRFYEEMIEEPELIKEAKQQADLRDLAGQAARYYHNIPNTSVGAHVNSGWRWRIN